MSQSARSLFVRSVLVPAALLLVGCRTRRVIEVTSDPAGALVRLDEDIVGRTPLEIDFQHYGRRRLTLYLAGYRAWTKRIRPSAPWYSRFPLDFLTEVVLPLGLEHRYDYHATLRTDTGIDDEGGAPAVDAFVQRAMALRAGLDQQDEQ